jgi:deoxyribonuclease V
MIACLDAHYRAGYALLFITAAGVSLERAADYIKAMHGPFRLPTLLKRVDQLCRGIV